MYKANYSDVKQLIKWGQDNKVVKHLIDTGAQPQINVIAYYHPSQANWSYQIGIVKVDGKLYELLTRFGSVEGGREMFDAQYNTNGEYNLN